MSKEIRTIKVEYLARVEGEGALWVKIRGDRVEEAQVRIFEPPRFFEAFLRGRHFSEAPDFTARICGICPVAYQMSSCQAMEDALGLTVPEPLRKLRRLLYLAEWLASHALHVFFLHAPDFLGYQDALQMSRDHGEMVKLGLKLKKAGNTLFALIGGREVHPVNVRVGGFYRVPAREELASLKDSLAWGREAALKTVRWTKDFPFPDLEPDYEFVALSHPEEYAILTGRLRSSRDLEIPVTAYEAHFEEIQAPYSHALQSRQKGGASYLVGPLARFNLNFAQLSPLAQEAAREAGVTPVCRNPFKSIVVRALEMVQATDEALNLIETYEPPSEPAVPAQPRAGVGCGLTEAPRGSLYHRYRLNEEGLIEEAKIVPPTSQNQKSMEQDLVQFAARNLNLPDEELTLRLEQVLRNYDPCISCATHTLRVKVVRD
jgi:sulfhydrogenase subunit alpha|uniref:Ni/Fe hydrogenase subunit alpha n=1 Tax=Desulfobacca acetoxidans TaxID=60893 RepID=A0A7C5EMV5_9BACT